MSNRDEELVGVLTAISVVAKRMAGNIIRRSQKDISREQEAKPTSESLIQSKGGKTNGKAHRGTANVRREAKPYCRYAG